MDTITNFAYIGPNHPAVAAFAEPRNLDNAEALAIIVEAGGDLNVAKRILEG